MLKALKTLLLYLIQAAESIFLSLVDRVQQSATNNDHLHQEGLSEEIVTKLEVE
jgi:hypothetical protein